MGNCLMFDERTLLADSGVPVDFSAAQGAGPKFLSLSFVVVDVHIDHDESYLRFDGTHGVCWR